MGITEDREAMRSVERADQPASENDIRRPSNRECENEPFQAYRLCCSFDNATPMTFERFTNQSYGRK
jgi:hypothetical protein